MDWGLAVMCGVFGGVLSALLRWAFQWTDRQQIAVGVVLSVLLVAAAK